MKLFCIWLIFKVVLCQETNILLSGVLKSEDNVSQQSEFILLDVEENFNDALFSCLQHNSTVAKVENLEEHVFISALINDLEDVDSFFIGLKRENIPKSFKFDDGVNDDNSFFETAAQ